MEIGKKCKDFRLSLEISLTQVAKDVGYTRQNIWNFENGLNHNYRILMWYVEHGLNLNRSEKE